MFLKILDRIKFWQYCHYKIINLDNITSEKNEEHNEKWHYISDHPHKILLIGGFGSGKTNALLNLINEQNDIDKIYLYAKNLNEPKYEFLIKKHENVGIIYCNNPNAFIECSNTMNNVYKNIDYYIQAENEKF